MKTKFQIKREKREARIVAHYARLCAQPGAMKTACALATMKQYGIAGKNTLHEICKRVEARSKQQAVC